MASAAPKTPKTLTITIDEDTTDLNLTYKITTPSTTTANDIHTKFVGDTDIDNKTVAKIFTEFLNNTMFKELYTKRLSSFNQLKPNIKNILFRDFAEVKELLHTLTGDQIRDFNTKALTAIKDWYTATSYMMPKFNLNLSMILTPAGQAFTKKGKVYNESLKINLDNLLNYVTKSTSHPTTYVTPNPNNIDTDIIKSDFLEKYIVIGPWSSQIFHWLEKYMADNTVTAFTAERKYFDFTGNSLVGYFRMEGGASNRTRKNKKTNYDSDE